MSAEMEAADPTLLHARQRVGSTLRGKWHLDQLLGMGGMAAVYAATHRNGARAAVKMLHVELSTHAQVRARFLKEGYVANKVEHPGVVRVLDDDVAEDGAVFLVMELLDGESLEDRRVRLGGKLELDEVLAAADQLLDVLAAAHEKGIVHRDIKPENIFLTRDGVIKVLDFGIARIRELSTASTATRTGTMMGTPGFMAPEHARGLWDEVDARTDLWSVGAMMFTMLSGRMVHEGRTVNEVLLAAMTQPAPALSSVCRVPGSVEEIVNRALAFDKNKRWTDARSMQNALREAYHDLSGAPISSRGKLIVPASVPDRTLPSAGVAAAAAGATTASAVASGKTAVSLESHVPAGRRSVLVWAGVGAAAVVVVSSLVVVPGRLVSRQTEPMPSTFATTEPTSAGRVTSTELAAQPLPSSQLQVDAGAKNEHGQVDGRASAPPGASSLPPAPLDDVPKTPSKDSKRVGKPIADAGARQPAEARSGEEDWKDRRR